MPTINVVLPELYSIAMESVVRKHFILNAIDARPSAHLPSTITVPSINVLVVDFF